MFISDVLYNTRNKELELELDGAFLFSFLYDVSKYCLFVWKTNKVNAED